MILRFGIPALPENSEGSQTQAHAQNTHMHTQTHKYTWTCIHIHTNTHAHAQRDTHAHTQHTFLRQKIIFVSVLTHFPVSASVYKLT